MEENKNIENQDDEIVSEDIVAEEQTQNQENAKENHKQEAHDCKSKRHIGRHKDDKALEEAKAQLEEQKAQFAELNDKHIRLFSEFDNYKKRTAKEKVEMLATASEGVIKDILPVFDDFERAIQNMEKNGNEADIQGVTLIFNKLKTILKAKGLEEIEAMDADFNTDEHEALTMIPATDESKKNKVLDVIQKGYKLNGKVIRYARVVVGA